MLYRRYICLSVTLAMAVLSSSCSVLFGDSADGASLDASLDSLDASLEVPCIDSICEAAGGRCGFTDQCDIDCVDDKDCVCPEETNCRLTIPETFTYAVDCSMAANCEIQCPGGSGGDCGNLQVQCGRDCSVKCVGDYTCNGNFVVLCGAGQCDLTCTGKGACWGATVSCGSTEACQLRCSGSACEGADFDCGDADSCNMRCSSADSCVNASLICEAPTECEFDCATDTPSPCE